MIRLLTGPDDKIHLKFSHTIGVCVSNIAIIRANIEESMLAQVGIWNSGDSCPIKPDPALNTILDLEGLLAPDRVKHETQDTVSRSDCYIFSPIDGTIHACPPCKELIRQAHLNLGPKMDVSWQSTVKGALALDRDLPAQHHQ